MFGSRGKSSSRAQIALEFLVVYAFISIVFAVVFTLIAAQRAATLAQQEYGLLQLQAQNIASYIDQAAQAGNGYSVTVPLVGAINSNPFNISISTSGVVFLQTKIIRQVISAYAFSAAKGMVVNGTLTSSGNGVSVYLIPAYTGSLSLSNSKGTIYVDQPAPSTVSLAQNINLIQAANLKVATFYGAPKGYVSIPSTSILKPSGSMTFNLWINENGYTSAYDVAQEGIASGNQQFFIRTRPDLGGSQLQFAYVNTARSYDSSGIPIATLGIAPGGWYDVAFVVNDISQMAYVYVNGVQKDSVASTTSSLSQNTNSLTIGGWSWDGYSAGTIANFQMYNTALSGPQITTLYSGGIGGIPVAPSNVVGWWPLNGNANDYSGNGNSGIAYNISYNAVIQVKARVTGGNGNAIVSAPIGFTTSKGIVSAATGGGVAYYTDANGNATAFITQNSFATGAANLTVTGFSGNATIAGNLIGWWPLNEGFGNVTYDLSTHGNTGTFNSPSWTSLTQNQTNFAGGSFPGVRGALTGTNGIGFVTINQSSSLLNLARNGSFTAVMWVDSYGGSATHDLGLIGDWPAHGRGFDLATFTSSSANALLTMVVNGTEISSATANLPANNWEMVAGEYNGSTGQAAMFKNSTQIMSNVIAKGLDLGQPTNAIYIGDDAWQLGGGDTFNGIITNVQLYSRYLTTSQIASLYKNGINSAPIGDMGLTGWWPLNGANNGIVNDYSSNNNTGVIKYNVTFNNAQYVNKVNTTFAVASFNGLADTMMSNNPVFGLSYNSPFAISAWIQTSNALEQTIAGKIAVPSSAQGYTMEVNAGGALRALFWDNNGNFRSVATSTTVNNGNWHNVIESYAGNGVVSLYIDGVSQTTTSNGVITGSIANSGSFTIGTRYSTSGFAYFNGNIANVQLYNSQLTAAQAQQIYQQGILLQKRQNVTLG
ncbi:MAG TPA: LamG-like jellyroll fold domain-containing protein [Candidatus Acidoferrales bacterium]|nr:LamG-like jellyroll fold domain-containing protein [Candidatus Acidoferrales bacterium]